jgi:ribonuclease P protein component
VKRGFRLSRPADVKRVRRLGKSYAHPFVLLSVLSNEHERLRVAVSAGRAVGGAVQRNRAKRILRAALAPTMPHVRKGHDLLLTARPAINGAKSTQLEGTLKLLLHKAKLIESLE